jgi:hypothetical protein
MQVPSLVMARSSLYVLGNAAEVDPAMLPVSVQGEPVSAKSDVGAEGGLETRHCLNGSAGHFLGGRTWSQYFVGDKVSPESADQRDATQRKREDEIRKRTKWVRVEPLWLTPVWCISTCSLTEGVIRGRGLFTKRVDLARINVDFSDDSRLECRKRFEFCSHGVCGTCR